MSGHLLNDDDLAELTGCQRMSDQKAWLEKRGIPYTTRRDGRPRLTWEVYNRTMLRVEHHSSTEPDLSWLEDGQAS